MCPAFSHNRHDRTDGIQSSRTAPGAAQERASKGNMNDIRQMRQGSCHCGTVRFQVRLSDGFNTARRCNCSYCRMRGAIAVSAALDDIEIVSGSEFRTCISSIPGKQSIISARSAGSTRTTSDAPTRINTASMQPAWKGSARSTLPKFPSTKGVSIPGTAPEADPPSPDTCAILRFRLTGMGLNKSAWQNQVVAQQATAEYTGPC